MSTGRHLSLGIPMGKPISTRAPGDDDRVVPVGEDEMLPARRSDYMIFLLFAVISLSLISFGLWEAINRF